MIVSHLSKSFPSAGGAREVLRDVSFEAPEGALVCLLGPNGSGKTTLLKTLCTLLIPETGRVLVDGLDVHRHPQAAKRLMGFASAEDQSFYGRLSARMNLWFYAQLHGLSRSGFADRLRDLGRELELDSLLERPFRELSNGQKQRLLLARALLHDPAVLLLDEPHQNLDPPFSRRLRELLIEEWGRRRRKTILLSTHHLEDAQKISDQWVVLSGGSVRFDGSLASVRDGNAAFSIEDFFQKLTQEQRLP